MVKRMSGNEVTSLPGWAYLAVIAALILLAFLLIWLLSYLMRDKLMAKLEYERSFSDSGVYEGENVILTETVRNPSFLPLFFVDVEAYIYNGIRLGDVVFEPRKAMQYSRSRFHLLPFMQIKRRHTVLCAERGYYMLETVDVFYGKKVRYISAPAEIYVYPKVVPIDDIAQPISSTQGDSVTSRRLIFDPFSVNGIRNYTFGDPFNSINFKATAKSGWSGLDGIKVNSRDYCSNRTILVYLNFQLSNDNAIPSHIYDPMMERGLSFAAALMREALYNGYRAGFRANCVLVSGEQSIGFPIESGEAHLREILREMAKVRCSSGISFSSMLTADLRDSLTETEIFVITPELPDEIAALMTQFSILGNTVHTVMLTGGDTDEA